ncbi:MAG: mandelate racemase [Candidatus Latescibacteria bacterium]|nr:mandelate racemase [Candidatus Latescibacterota bacterium]
MKITALETVEIAASPRGNWIFVLLHTDAGLSGLGEASQSGNDRLVQVVLGQLGEKLVGRDPTQVEVLWEQMTRAASIFSGDVGRVGATAVSAVDQALWDLSGKAYGVPVWQLLGGPHRQQVRLYANLNRGTQDRSPEGFARAAVAAVEAGFQAVKCTPFDEVHHSRFDRHGIDQAAALGVERIAATRQAIGADIELLVDCHCRFDLPLAMKVARQVEPLNLYWFEEPVPRHQLAAMQQLCQLSGQTIAGGESFFGRREFWPSIAEGGLHVIMPDVKHAGGITECRRIAALAEVEGVPVAPHSPAGPVSTLAGVHLAASIANFLVLEFAFGEVDWRAQLVRPAEVVDGGLMALPQGPGLGIELDEAMVAAHRVDS